MLKQSLGHTSSIFQVRPLLAVASPSPRKPLFLLFALPFCVYFGLCCVACGSFARVEATFNACSGLRQFVLRAAKMLPILLGLLAKIKCSICSYQFNL